MAKAKDNITFTLHIFTQQFLVYRKPLFKRIEWKKDFHNIVDVCQLLVWKFEMRLSKCDTNESESV